MPLMTDGMTATRRDAVSFAEGVYLALPGASSHIATVLGAVLAFLAHLLWLRTRRRMPGAVLKGVSGISAGAAVAAAVAFGVEDKLPRILRHWLQHRRVLDFAPDGKVGLCRWERVRELIEEVIGPGVTMGQARIPLAILVADADAAARGDECTVVLSSWGTPNVLVVDAVAAAMAIVPLAPPCAIPSLGTAMSPDRRRFFDCGFRKNIPDDVWDFASSPTVSFSCRQRQVLTGKPVRVSDGDPLAVVEALVGAVSQALNERRTSRKDGMHIVLDAVGSSLDFDLTPEETTERISNGRRSVEAALADMEGT